MFTVPYVWNNPIKNGFKNVFGNSFNHVMCWAHAKRMIENRLYQVNHKDKAKELLRDIELLQLSILQIYLNSELHYL